MATKALEEHRIKEIRTLRVSSRYTRTIGRNSRIKNHGDGPNSQIRVVTTDRGVTGWGISWIPDEKIPVLTGRPVAELFDPAVGVIADEAMPLDFALHDLAGVILGLSVSQMLGGNGESAIPCYDGAIYMEDLVPEESPRGIAAIIESCRSDYEMGYRAFKIKIGRGYQWMSPEEGFRRDIDVTCAVCENFPDCRILVDVNDAYTCGDTIRYMEAVADCNIFWIEEPFQENRDDLLKLKEYLARKSPDTLIADGESALDLNFLLELAREELLDVLQMDIAGWGFTRWRRTMPELIKAGVAASPHTWGDPLKVYYSAQLAAGMGNILALEGIPSKTYGADVRLYRLVEGVLYVPEKSPGFGMRLGN